MKVVCTTSLDDRFKLSPEILQIYNDKLNEKGLSPIESPYIDWKDARRYDPLLIEAIESFDPNEISYIIIDDIPDEYKDFYMVKIKCGEYIDLDHMGLLRHLLSDIDTLDHKACLSLLKQVKGIVDSDDLL